MEHIYDVIILGAGPAGLSAGLYAGRSRLDTLIIEKGQAGGQIINTDEIENYPGQIVEGETGVSLVRRMYEQTEQFGAKLISLYLFSVKNCEKVSKNLLITLWISVWKTIGITI